MSLFVAIPFAYFFTESEGFAGSRKVTFIIITLVNNLLSYMYCTYIHCIVFTNNSQCNNQFIINDLVSDLLTGLHLS